MKLPNCKVAFATLIINCFLISSLYAQDINFWGYGYIGGNHDNGFIYKTDDAGNNLQIVHHFEGEGLGKNPSGNLILHQNGLIYGTTLIGGNHNKGILFTIDPITNTFEIIYHFIDGNPSGSIINTANGKLYGYLLKSFGKIYEFDVNTKTFTIVHHFNNANGKSGFAHKMIEVSDNLLYGVASRGGTHEEGVIFKFNVTTKAYEVLYEFDDTHGKRPQGIIRASDGLLYGLADGGANNRGVLFSFDLNSKEITVLKDFTVEYNNQQKGLLEASDGNLYGVSTTGGTHGNGALFTYNTTSKEASIIYEFSSSIYIPDGDLMEAQNGNLYGITRYGGSGAGLGTIYQYDIDNKSFQVVASLNDGFPTEYRLLEVDTSTLSIESNELDTEMVIYPNPVKSEIIIQHLPIDIDVIEMYSLNGRLVYKTLSKISTSSIEISRDGLANGMYIIKGIGKDTSFVRKVLLK